MAVAISMSGDSKQMVHPFFVPKGYTAPLFETPFDQNESRRKRRRTGSIGHEPPGQEETIANTWADQLKAAAHGTSLTSFEAPCTAIASHETTISTAGDGKGLHDQQTLSAGSGTSSNEAKEVSYASSNKQNLTTPPKKMIKVRPDGKLGSPMSKTTIENPKIKRKRKKINQDISPKSMVAIMKYGSGDTSRLIIAQRIDHIWLGLDNHSGPEIAKQTKSSKAIGPPKPTHPFFLGGAPHPSSQPTTAASSDVRKAELHDTSAKQVKVESPRKGRVNSKPAGVTADSAKAFGFERNPFCSDSARLSRYPGAVEPLWPPRGMVHVGRATEMLETSTAALQCSRNRGSQRKLKVREVHVPEEEEVLKSCVDLVRAWRDDESIRTSLRDRCELQRPLRRIMTGYELQQAVRQNTACQLPSSQSEQTHDMHKDELSDLHPIHDPIHKALLQVYEGMATSLSAFDKFECETQDWMHKYAPNCAESILQQGREVTILRDWLQGLIVNSVESKSDDVEKLRASSRKRRKRTAKKKRKRAESLENFVISMDDEGSQMSEITDSETTVHTNSTLKKSVLRAAESTGGSSNGSKASNTVVISGSHGCGKTAAVYAVAQELGFEVFEINAGSRRSGKEVLDKVGDVTRNHLVKHSQGNTTLANQDESLNEETVEAVDSKLKQDLESGRQGTMKSFFKPKGTTPRKPTKSKQKAQKARSKPMKFPKERRSQKQSLILLEEVDILFEEDKLFWTTTLELILQSKRPIIMTCTDESQLPLDDMALYAILRFVPPTEPLATDYLLLIAANEGHLLSRDAVSTLYMTKGADLRASIAELNLFCQIGIGDTKGGLEWMLIPSTSEKPEAGSAGPQRVISEGTYQSGMGLLGCGSRGSSSVLSLQEEAEILSEVWDGWEFDLGTTPQYLSASTSVTDDKASERQALESLRCLDQCTDTLSAVDIFPACVTRHPDMYILDTDLPELMEKTRNSFVEGSNVVQGEPIVDQTGVTTSMALTLRSLSRRLVQCPDIPDGAHPLSQQSIMRIIPELIKEERHSSQKITKSNLPTSFEPLARSSNAVIGASRGTQITSLDGPASVIATDLAPYVRSIVSYDLRLEEQRRKLSDLLSQPGRDGMKTRTTRASRAALEGGHKAFARRERWFPKAVDFDMVLRSGGRDWQEVLLQRMSADSAESMEHDGSRRSSLASAIEDDV